MSIFSMVNRLLTKMFFSFILCSMDTNKFLKFLGDRIRTLRKSRKISQEKLAELSGLHPSYISDIENGKVNASIYSYYTIAHALGMSLPELTNLPEGAIDREIETGIAELLGSIRNLNRKKRILFLSAAKGLISGIEKAK